MGKPVIFLCTTVSLSSVLIRGQSRYLRDAGFEVYVLSSDGPEMRKLTSEEGATFIPIPINREISLLRDILSLFLAVKHIKKLNPHIINSGTPKAGLIFMVAAYLCNVPNRVFTLHGLRSSTLTGVKKLVVKFTEKLCCKLANEVICVSRSLRKEAIDAGIVEPKKSRVLLKGSCNGVDITKFNINYDVSILPQKKINYQLTSGCVLIGFVGRLVKEKGIQELYSAFKILRREYNIKLVLIGPREVDDALPNDFYEEINSDKNVFIVGKVDDIENYYPLLDMLVLPSYREGFGNVIIECAAMGVPAIAADIAGCRDAVDNDKTGLLFISKSVEDLSVKLKFYLDNPDLRRKHGIDAAERVIEFFSNEKIWDEQLKLYTKLLEMNEYAIKRLTSV